MSTEPNETNGCCPNESAVLERALDFPRETEVASAPVREPVTAAQARVESVAHALDAAYRQASTLKLTEDEAAKLAADFPDEAFSLGAGGDPNLVYIEHAYLRQRLNQVLGVGAAVPIRRREWAEEFQYYKDGRNKTGVRVYVDLALVVRGCMVGEAIGDAVYYPDNAKTNYSDALESAKSNAFRRCAKEFGVGLQAWMKGWCHGWKERQRQAKPVAAPVHAAEPAQKPAAAESEPYEALVMVKEIKPIKAKSGKEMRCVVAEGGTDYLTFHKMEGIVPGDYLVCKCHFSEKGGKKYRWIDDWNPHTEEQ